MRVPEKFVQALVIGAGAAAIGLGVSGAGVMVELEHLTWNLRARALAQATADDPKIRLVLIDERSIQTVHQTSGVGWPWPRSAYAEIVDFCRDAGARAIAIDMLFVDASYRDQDELFGESIARTPGYVGALHLGESHRHHAWPPEVPASPWTVDGLDAWLAEAGSDTMTYPTAGFAVPEIARRTRLHGHIVASPDADGRFRRGAPLSLVDGRPLPMLGLAAALAPPPDVAAPDAWTPAPMSLRDRWLIVGDRSIPVDGDGRTIIRYRQPLPSHHDRSYPTYSAAAVIDAQLAREAGATPGIDPAVFEDAYVFVGLSAVGAHDTWSTPIGRQLGIDIHANFLDNFLNERFLRDAPAGAAGASVVVLAVLGALTVLLCRTGLQTGLSFVILALPWVVGFASYGPGLWWPIAVPQLALLISMLAAVLLNYATEGRRRMFLRRAFQQYLSAPVIDRILEDPSKLRLGGERRELTILFSDLEGFSGIAESLEAEALGELLNDYLTDMSDVILGENGTIDKYQGDAILAFWNAPSDQPDHALRACRAAARCQTRLAEQREAYRRRTGVELVMRIGVHTGVVGVGNFGSEHRFDYTVIGNAANLASRLEEANKHFGTHTMLSEFTLSRLAMGGGDAALDTREIGVIRVVGIERPVRVYELLTGDDPARAPRDAFQAAVALAQAGEMRAALAAFEAWPEDALALRYVARLREACEAGGPAWDGVFRLATK